MRRFRMSAWVALAILATVPLTILAAVSLRPATPADAAAVAKTLCTITDHRVVGLSGLIATAAGFVAISDSNPDKNAIRIWFFDRTCHVTRSISYPTSAYDPEDMALGRDGAIYVADIGDNHRSRATIAVWRVSPGSSTPHIYRYAYPDHAHDAEAMLLATDDTPIFVTKDVGIGEIFTPTAPADPSGRPVRLKRVGSFEPPPTSTPNFLGIAGGLLVTGGANAHDRSMVALRTYADAFVWSVSNGNVVTAITTTKPRIVPLPHEPQGESIAFDPTGDHIYTVSDLEVEPVRTPILEYDLPAPKSSASPKAGPVRAARPSSPPVALPGTAETQPLWPYAILVAVVLIVTGVVFGTRRRRRN